MISIMNKSFAVVESDILKSNESTVMVVEGDILKSNESYIVHQCNCITVNSYGLAKSINTKYPWANLYSKRKKIGNTNYGTVDTRDIPGTIKICSSPLGNKNIICMFAQYNPGKPKLSKSLDNIIDNEDTSFNRSKWFTECLDKIAKELPNVKTFSFPFYIGCGLAGGNWVLYKKHLDNFSKLYNKNVILYKLIT